MYRFAIVRILGNENPPRDVANSRLSSLKFILDNEPAFPDTTKIYVLNKIVDDEFKAKLINLLDEYKANYIELPVAWDKLGQLDAITDQQLNLEVIGINAARNKAIAAGHKVADYTIVFDGDCLFDAAGWEAFNTTVEERCKKFYRYYFSIPTTRIKPEQYNQITPTLFTEPMPVIHRDSIERFDERLLFGQCDKLELLFRLGHDMTPDTNHCTVVEGKTTIAGYCCHLQTGEDIVEENVAVRMHVRELSLQALWQKTRNKLKSLIVSK